MAEQKKASDVIIEKLDKSLTRIETNLSSKLDKVEERMHRIELTAVRHEGSLNEHMRRTLAAEAAIEKSDLASIARVTKLEEVIKIMRDKQSEMEKFQNRIMGAVLILTPVTTFAVNYLTR